MIGDSSLSGTGEGRAITIVVPVHNEAENISPLCREILASLSDAREFEILFVDDGSTDDTPAVLRSATEHTRVRSARLARRCGQSAALLLGVRRARHELIVTLDGDGQNDPADIDRLLARMPVEPPGMPGTLVIGCRVRREDGWVRRVSSRIANGVRRRLLADDTSDTGCGIKVFGRQAWLELPWFDHMHRFLPALFKRAGGRVVSVPVSHRPRRAGCSKYGVRDRLWVGILDLLGVMWLARRYPSGMYARPRRRRP